MRDRFAVILTAILVGGALGGATVVYVSRTPPDNRVIEGQTLAYWVRCLESDNEDLRLKAVGVLPKFGVSAIPAVMPKLGTSVGQDGAVDVLAKLGEPAVRPLIEALEDGTTQTRLGAIRALDQMGPSLAAPAATPVSRLLNDDATGPLAAKFLAHVGPNVDAIGAALDTLANGHAERQVHALKVLGRASGTDPRVEPALRRHLGDTDVYVRVAAFEALCYLTPPSVDAAPLMIDGLTRSEFRAAARIGLMRLMTDAIPTLHQCTTRPAADLRMQAVELLTAHVAADPRARAALVDFLNDKDTAVAGRAAASLVGVREKDLPFVRKQLASPHPKVRLWAISELRRVQPPLIDELAVLLDDPDESVRNLAYEAIRGLWQVDDLTVMHAPESKDVEERIRGIRLLPFFKNLGKYDMMLAAMEDVHPRVRLAAARAMGRSLTSGRVVQRLVEAMEHDVSSEVRVEAALALRAARSTFNVESALRKAANDPDPTVAAAATMSLQRSDLDR